MAVESYIKFTDVRKRLARANYTALNTVSAIMFDDITQYVPMKTGALRASGRYDFTKSETSNSFKDGIEFSWERPDLTVEFRNGTEKTYNGRMVTDMVYQGFNPVKGTPIVKYTTPGTGAFWDKIAVEEKMDEWKENFVEEFTDQFRQHRQQVNMNIDFK